MSRVTHGAAAAPIAVEDDLRAAQARSPMTAPSVSVVVTCFNLDRFIGEALASVTAQENPPPFEIIVVDDCSTDNSPDIIRQCASATYLKTERNGGVLQAMIAGVERAHSDIICLLDGDDLWAPDKLARVATEFEHCPDLALVTHDLSFIDGSGRPLDRSSRPHLILSPLAPDRAGETVRQGILDQADYVWLGSALSFRRGKARWRDFVEFARALPDPANCYQDWPLAYWIASLSGVRLGYVQEALLRYRIHGANHSGDARTLERAARNFERTCNTHEAISRIATLRGLKRSVQRRARVRARFTRAQADLYAGRRFTAGATFLASLRSAWLNRVLLKEMVRFAIGIALGPRALVGLGSLRGRSAQKGRSKSEMTTREPV